jgi:membrane protein DedA with SNARE-associated domain
VARHGGRRFLDNQAPAGRSRHFRVWFLRYGLLTVFIPALVPIPLPMKIFVISAGALQVPIAGFLGVVLLARTLRYGGEAWLGAQVGEHSTAFLKDHVTEMVLLAVALFALLYVLIRLSDRWRKPITDLS